MLHIFFVHSFATYHCARGVMEAEGLAGESCIFILTRSFRFPDTDEKITSGTLKSYGEPNLNSVRRLIDGKRNLRKRDKELSDMTGGRDFFCYTPHVYYDFVEFCITHPLCSGFSYLEEGLTSYYKPGEIDKAYPPWNFTYRARVLRALLFGKRLQENVHFFRPGYQKAYGFSSDSFPGWERREILGIERLLPSLLHGERPAYSPVIVFDALVELGMTSACVLGEAVSQLLKQFQMKGVREIHYKFHPSQRPESSIDALNEIFEHYRQNFALKELPREVSLEDLFSRNEMPVFVFNSASGIYASLAGQKVFSLNSLLTELDPPYERMIRGLPAIYEKLVKPLDDLMPLGLNP